MNDITEEEAQQYDRQIRLWGADAQKRLKNATVILIGVNGVSCEVIKNLVLAGINTLAICDQNNVKLEDINANFLISRSAMDENRAKSVMTMTKQLNPRVNVEFYDHMPTELSRDKSNNLSLKNYDIVICCESKLHSFTSDCLWSDLNEICRKYEKPFFAMDSFGWFGLTFVDLGNHYYIKDEQVNQKDGDKPSTSDANLVPQVKEFYKLRDVMSIDWSKSESQMMLKRMPNSHFLLIVVQQFVGTYGHYPSDTDNELIIDLWQQFVKKHGVPHQLVSSDSVRLCLGAGQQPINTVLGGLVTQEIIKAISGKNEPFGNFVIFDGITCVGSTPFIKP